MAVHNTSIGEGTRIYDPELSNIRGAKIGKNCIIHSGVWIGEEVVIGDNCKVQAFAFIPTCVTIEDNVFIGPGVVFTNDADPKATGPWKPLGTRVKRGASIGANSTILPGADIGANTTIGAGSVVTKPIPDNVVACGSPARVKAGKARPINL